MPDDVFDLSAPLTDPAARRTAPAEHLTGIAASLRELQRRIDAAAGADELVAPSGDVVQHAVDLRRLGMGIAFISRLTTALNRRLIRRLFLLTAPAGLVDDACLIVMGSEGRGEQILKTDQDNGVILRDGAALSGMDAALTEFSQRLEACGYPPCPGGVMACNPDWAKPQSAYRQSLSRWLRAPDDASRLKLAILFDAAPAAGDPSLLTALRRDLLAGARDNQGFLHHFAKPTLAFGPPPRGWLDRLFRSGEKPSVDLKKAAIFPLVHGARTLALEAGLDAAHTAERLEGLAQRRALDPGLARDLIDAFFFVSALRLDARLADPRRQPANVVAPIELPRLTRAGLDDCLSTIGRFQELLARRFRLDA